MPRTQCTVDRSGNSVHCQCSDGSSKSGSCHWSGGGLYCNNPCSE